MLPLGQQENGMSQDDPLVCLALLGCAIWIGKQWLDDFRSKDPNALPGATPCSQTGVWIAITGALVILVLETFGELITKLEEEQSTIVWYFLAAMVAAAVLEELVFRGYLVISKKGRGILVASAVGFSLLFALAHPYLWTFSKEEGLSMHLSSHKAWLTTGFLYLKSLWFYYVRFAKWNPQQSLIPCVVAHLAINLATFAIKASQGKVVW